MTPNEVSRVWSGSLHRVSGQYFESWSQRFWRQDVRFFEYFLRNFSPPCSYLSLIEHQCKPFCLIGKSMLSSWVLLYAWLLLQTVLVYTQRSLRSVQFYTSLGLGPVLLLKLYSIALACFNLVKLLAYYDLEVESWAVLYAETAPSTIAGASDHGKVQ